MFQAHLTIAVLLLGLAICFFIAGARRLLNTIDYRVIKDTVSFNRYVGARLLLPAFLAAGSAAVTYGYPALGVPLLFVIPLSVLVVVVWIGVGSRRFSSQACVAD